MPYCKFYKEKEQVSYDSGETWHDVPDSYRKGELYEFDSPDCNPFSTLGKWSLKHIEGNVTITKTAPCDGSSAITQSDLDNCDYFHSEYFVVGDCVTSIGDNTFSGCNSITDLTIGSGVTSIGSNAFNGCSGFTSVTIPDSVTYIGCGAFGNTPWLSGYTADTSHQYGNIIYFNNNVAYKAANTGITNCTFKSNTTEIMCNAFSSCSSLNNVIIPNSVTYIGKYAFGECYSITDLNIPNSVTYIDDRAFYFCTNLTNVNIPSGVTSINDYTFRECVSLTGITIPNSVTSIGERAFDDCGSLISVTIGNSVTSIGQYAFQNCRSLTSITINATTPPALGSNAFNSTNNCPIYVPAELVEVYQAAWSNYANRITSNERWIINPNAYECSGTTKMSQEKKQLWDGSVWNDVIPLETRIGSDVIEYKSPDCGYVLNVKYKFTLNDSTVVSGECDASSAVTQAEISAYTSTLTSAEIGDCITEIGNNAFSGCTNLTSIDIPSGVTTIGEQSFLNCSGLTSIVIPDSVTSIGNYAFGFCSGLTSCAIGTGVTSIGGYIFRGCISLTSIGPVGSGASIEIPSSVTSIGTQAFESCTGLTSCTIGTGVTSIGESAFEKCSSLTSIEIPDSVTIINDRAFASCYSLTSCTIGSGVTSINGSYFGGAFTSCRSLTSITINAVTPPTLGWNAFSNTNNCPIYVPSGSVETYKNAGGYWSSYASRIQAIP